MGRKERCELSSSNWTFFLFVCIRLCYIPIRLNTKKIFCLMIRLDSFPYIFYIINPTKLLAGEVYVLEPKGQKSVGRAGKLHCHDKWAQEWPRHVSRRISISTQRDAIVPASDDD